MRVLKAIWNLLVGIKDALVLLFMILFFAGLYALLSARPAPTVAEGVLHLNLRAGVVEQPAEQDAFALAGGGSVPTQHALRDVRAALLKARDDERVKAVALDLDGFSAGQTVIADLGEALDAVKRSGKPVLAYATGYSDDGYQLAAHAGEIWLNPMGVVQLSGPGGNNLYFAGLLEKLGVTANVYRVGTYKSAVEPFTRSDMSPEARQNAQGLASSLFETWRDDVVKARPQANINAALTNPAALVRSARGDFAAAAQAARLVDKVGERQAFQARLAELGGADDRSPAGFKRIRLDRYIAAEVRPAMKEGGPIGVVTVAGNIVDGRAPLGTAGGDSIAESIEKGLRDERIKALVVRIDSPGGSALASERIRQALLAARKKNIPVVASMGNVAASGGYWVATAANHIVAEPSTITGSIGVFGILPSFQGSLQKLGIAADGVKTTPLSGEPDLLNGPSPQASELIQLGVESIYGKFLGIVAEARRKTPQQVDAIGQGRVWSGGQARQVGLVDQFGGMEEAIAKAAELAKLDQDNRGVTYLERKKSWRSELAGLLRDDEDSAEEDDPFASLRARPDMLALAALREVELLVSGPTIQARCLACGPVESAPVVAAPPSGWFARLLTLLS
ncbi:signal peptide peptidase SppA [Sphingomonas sp. LHG3406-1]|uniref:signal peptide peptidase SppA n=1 Tax=Sphingomonas sp. LHG3406-1 TaxID=2804617 RepID=UPI0026238560|nr:signal peptide peptidase SppA [Sphingomonas sp. LHG3406-1]